MDKQFWKSVINIIVTVLTALAGALCLSSCLTAA